MSRRVGPPRKAATSDVAVEAGSFPQEGHGADQLLSVLDSGAAKDTYDLLRSAIQKLMRAAGEECLPRDLRTSLGRYVKDAKPDIDWDDAEARQAELRRVVIAAGKLLDEVYDDELKEAAELLAAIVLQDVEIDRTGVPRIRDGTEKDRIVSTSAPDMRHGPQVEVRHRSRVFHSLRKDVLPKGASHL